MGAAGDGAGPLLSAIALLGILNLQAAVATGFDVVDGEFSRCTPSRVSARPIDPRSAAQ